EHFRGCRSTIWSGEVGQPTHARLQPLKSPHRMPCKTQDRGQWPLVPGTEYASPQRLLAVARNRGVDRNTQGHEARLPGTLDQGAGEPAVLAYVELKHFGPLARCRRFFDAIRRGGREAVERSGGRRRTCNRQLPLWMKEARESCRGANHWPLEVLAQNPYRS